MLKLIINLSVSFNQSDNFNVYDNYASTVFAIETNSSFSHWANWFRFDKWAISRNNF